MGRKKRRIFLAGLAKSGQEVVAEVPTPQPEEVVVEEPVAIVEPEPVVEEPVVKTVAKTTKTTKTK
jgi:hypothetical protein